MGNPPRPNNCRHLRPIYSVLGHQLNGSVGSDSHSVGESKTYTRLFCASHLQSDKERIGPPQAFRRTRMDTINPFDSTNEFSAISHTIAPSYQQ